MNYNKKSVKDIDVSGKKVFLRCDFNVPLDENGEITDLKILRDGYLVEFFVNGGTEVYTALL